MRNPYFRLKPTSLPNLSSGNNSKMRFCLLAILLFPLVSIGQNADSLGTKLDSLKQQRDTAGQVNLIEPSFYDERTKMNWRTFRILLANDFKQQFLSPLDIKGKGWLTGAALVAGTIGISFLDKPVERAFLEFRDNHSDVEKVSHTITNIGGIYQGAVFATFATYGFIFKQPKLRTTTALATQSYITSVAWSTMFKYLSGRKRPNDPSNSPKFNGPFHTNNSSFPSQHATLAFAAARVYAMEYKNIPAVPIISYSVASLITISRLTENKHWLTDLVAGTLLGLACGTQVVNNYHRYAKLARTGKLNKKGRLTTNIQYVPGAGVMPGFVYTFR